VTRVEGLKELSISDPKLATLPATIGDLAELETLTLELSAMKVLPSLAKLTKLKVLSIQSASLAQIPEGALPPNLDELSLTLDKCTTLPASIGRLKRLTKLTLSGGFTSLPAALGKLGALKELW